MYICNQFGHELCCPSVIENLFLFHLFLVGILVFVMIVLCIYDYDAVTWYECILMTWDGNINRLLFGESAWIGMMVLLLFVASPLFFNKKHNNVIYIDTDITICPIMTLRL